MPSENGEAIMSLFLGASFSGKTFLMVSIINAFYLDEFDVIFIFAPQYKSQRNLDNYKRLKKKAIIFTYFNEEKIQEIIDKTPHYVPGNPRILIVLDDCVKYFRFSLQNDRNILSDIVMNGKHKGISCFILSQALKSVSTTIRNGITNLFLFKFHYMGEVVKYTDFTPYSKKKFGEVYNKIMTTNKENYPFVYVHDGVVYNRLKDI